MIASEQFKQEVWDWAKEIGVTPKEIHIRKMKRKLASCSSNGRLSFDPSLMHEVDRVRLEAIIHELLHLKYPNHGRMFHAMLKIYSRSLEKEA
jgi:predicted metal-dependent hydrolase